MDCLAGILELIGIYLVGEKKKICFIFFIGGSITWIIYVFITKSTCVLRIPVVPALFMNVWNYIKWSKGDKK